VKVIHFTEPEQIGTSLESIVSAQIFALFLAEQPRQPTGRIGSVRTFFAPLERISWRTPVGSKISQLEIDGRPVAWNYGFSFRGELVLVPANFSNGVRARLRPGSCLLSPPGSEEGAKGRLSAMVGTLDWETETLQRSLRQQNQADHVTFTFRADFPRHVVSCGPRNVE